MSSLDKTPKERQNRETRGKKMTFTFTCLARRCGESPQAFWRLPAIRICITTSFSANWAGRSWLGKRIMGWLGKRTMAVAFWISYDEHKAWRHQTLIRQTVQIRQIPGKVWSTQGEPHLLPIVGVFSNKNGQYSKVSVLNLFSWTFGWNIFLLQNPKDVWVIVG